jgi:two-component system sensor histidine kinase BaeS
MSLVQVAPLLALPAKGLLSVAARNTSGEIRHRQGQTLARDARINDALLGYAASHPRWDGVEETVRGLARHSDRRVALATESGTRIADSAAGRPPLPARASAVVDPLAVDVSLVPGAATDRIDARVVGPFRLPEPERVRLREQVDAQAACLRHERQRTTVAVGPGGRPYLRREGGQATPALATPAPATPAPATPAPATRVPGTDRPGPPVGAPSGHDASTPPGMALARASGGGGGRLVAAAATLKPAPSIEPAEKPQQPRTLPGTPTGAPGRLGGRPTVGPERTRPAPSKPGSPPCSPDAPGPTTTEKRALNRLAALVRQCHGSRVDVWLDETGKPAAPASAAECLATARRTQLKPYVAPAALLYIGSLEDRTPAIDPYGIAGVTAVILVLAAGVSVLVATRLVRPVRAVTAAARRMRAGDGSRGSRCAPRARSASWAPRSTRCPST